MKKNASAPKKLADIHESIFGIPEIARSKREKYQAQRRRELLKLLAGLFCDGSIRKFYTAAQVLWLMMNGFDAGVAHAAGVAKVRRSTFEVARVKKVQKVKKKGSKTL